jgi:hypothetical protein
MIRFILIPLSVMLSCGSTKTSQSSAKADSLVVTQPADLNQKDSVIAPKEINTAVPTCIKNKIDSFKLKEPHERPQSVVEYTYKGKKVYYVVMPCCDFFNEVYDENCRYLGAPNGGFTGKGDGKIPDFDAEAKPGKEIWKSAK